MDAILREILEIPTRAQAVLSGPTDMFPLYVPYLGMGSSYFAPLAFHYLGVPIYPELASEYASYLAHPKKSSMAVLLSQSGRSSEVLWCRPLFDAYVAVSNDPSSDLCTAPNVVQVAGIEAGIERYSSSKTYVNTLLVLFKGLGFTPATAVAHLVRNMAHYQAEGQRLAEQVFALLQQHPIHGIYITGSGPNTATALEAALILSETTKLAFQGLAMAQYDHGPKETARNSIVIQILAAGPAYERTRRLSEVVASAGGHVLTVEDPGIDETYSILTNIIPFNFMAYFLAQHLGIGETFVVGGKVTEAE